MTPQEARDAGRRAILDAGWTFEPWPDCRPHYTGPRVVRLSPCTDWTDPYEAARVYAHEGTHVCQRLQGATPEGERPGVVPAYVNGGWRWSYEVEARASEAALRVTLGLPVAGDWAADEAKRFCERGYAMGRVRDCEERAREALEYTGRWYRPRGGL